MCKCGFNGNLTAHSVKCKYFLKCSVAFLMLLSSRLGAISRKSQIKHSQVGPAVPPKAVLRSGRGRKFLIYLIRFYSWNWRFVVPDSQMGLGHIEAEFSLPLCLDLLIFQVQVIFFFLTNASCQLKIWVLKLQASENLQIALKINTKIWEGRLGKNSIPELKIPKAVHAPG